MISKHPKCWHCGRDMIPARRTVRDFEWMYPHCDLGVDE